MKAISLKQPFAALVAAGVKQFETRKWRTNYRGPLLIHASLAPHPLFCSYDFRTEKLQLDNHSAKRVYDLPKYYTLRSGEMMCVVDTFLIAQKAYASHNMVMPILYCNPMWPMNSTNEGDFYEPGLPIERWGERSKTRVLWAACGIWEVVFVLKHLPQEWSYDSGCFENRFTSPMEAEKHLVNYIFEKSRLSI